MNSTSICFCDHTRGTVQLHSLFCVDELMLLHLVHFGPPYHASNPAAFVLVRMHRAPASPPTFSRITSSTAVPQSCSPATISVKLNSAFFSRPAASSPPHRATQALPALPSHRPRQSRVQTIAAALHSMSSHHRAAALPQPLCRRPTIPLPTTACTPQPPPAHFRLHQGAARAACAAFHRFNFTGRVRLLFESTSCLLEFSRAAIVRRKWREAQRGRLAFPHGLKQLNSFTCACGSLRKLNPPYRALLRLLLLQGRDYR